ncbi:translation elongation factor 4 [Patescibacteria group bacterium]
MDTSQIRNFSIVAHIDHGKSTLADRLLEVTKTVAREKMREQLLDQMDLERERGITIKMQPVNMVYEKDGKSYRLNLIDTPGHSDFVYEVSRAMQAVEGAVLLVDATQGVEAQTISNLEIAKKQDLTIIPVINKIDLPNADVEKVSAEIRSVCGCEDEDILLTSAKTGEGIEDLLTAIIERVPAPKGNCEGEVRALVFDSIYDPYRGVRASIRMVDGALTQKNMAQVMRSGKSAKIVNLGQFKPQLKPETSVECGMTGYIETGFKELVSCRVGDTITAREHPAEKILPGYEEPQPKVFASMFLSESEDVSMLERALEKLQSNDSALVYSPIRSDALGHGFRVGLLGLLHLEIIQERIEREFNLSIIITSPTVPYKIQQKGKNGTELIHNPSELPDPAVIEKLFEPWARVEVVTYSQYMGKIMEMATEKRGIFIDSKYFGDQSVTIQFELPLAEIFTGFYDSIKRISSGYASFSYELLEYREGNLAKLAILVNGDPVDALSAIVPSENAARIGRTLVERLKKSIPKKQFEITLQAALNGKIVARADISPMRKDVTAKLYGGDVTRKRKLLEKQKAGKKRMKQVGGVDLPQEAFFTALRAKTDSDYNKPR